MSLIMFFAPQEDRVLRRLMRAAAQRLPHEPIALCRTAEELVEYTLRAACEMSTVVLYAPTDDALATVLPLKDMLRRVRTIIILPDENDVTLARAMQLRPCYLTSANGNMNEVIAVLEKIAQHTVKTRMAG
jgi:hypothetical protein